MARALISVYDKTGIVEFAAQLIDQGFEVVSTGGTYNLLKEKGLTVLKVSEVTEFPEILEGRVKTLHPKIHGGILAKDTKEHRRVLHEQGIVPIDLVVVNLYPFEETIKKPGVTLEEALENIDIGGPTMVRAAAKNFPRVAVVVNPNRYRELLQQLLVEGTISLDTRKALAAEAFAHTHEYDQVIAQYLSGSSEQGNAKSPAIKIVEARAIRYGENPHQGAHILRLEGAGKGIAEVTPIQGKPLSYNNYLDTHAAWGLIQEFDQAAVAIIKHNNPCGVALGNNLHEAYLQALACDPISAFGGIVAVNQGVDKELAEALTELFYEVVAAPSFTKESLNIFAQKPNVRLLPMEGIKQAKIEYKSIGHSMLAQETDKKMQTYTMDVVTQKKPKETELAALDFAYRVAKWVKSNAIVIAAEQATVGIGAGQMNRVSAARIAVTQAGEKALGAVLASDAFIPFADTVELAAEQGIRAIIQPGGSVNDEEVIQRCNEVGLAMVFTGRRHFKH